MIRPLSSPASWRAGVAIRRPSPPERGEKRKPNGALPGAPFRVGADGKWTKLKDPDDKGGDINKSYEDKLSLIWNIHKSIIGFDEKFGCQASRHAGEPGKPYGARYTEDDGERGVISRLKYVRGGFLGQLDNHYLDSTRFEKDKAPFDDAKFAAGDEGASILVEPFTGERGVIKTSAKFDVQFTDLWKVYSFGATFFDNAQVRHAQVREPLHLTFAK